MTETQPFRFRHDPRKLVECLFDRAKRWWIATSLFRLGSVVAGTVSVIFFPRFTPAAALILMGYIAAELSAWRSDSFKASAEAILRKLDFKSSFGWGVSRDEMADLIVDCPARLRKNIPPPVDKDTYFASRENLGTAKALENLQESSWWSKHLAKRMGHITLAVTAILVFASVMVLILSINTLKDFDTLANIGRAVTSVLMLVLSLGLIRLVVSYYRFSKRAERIEGEAVRQLSAGSNELEAVKTWHEYQVARALAPLIPSIIWNRMNKDLNEAWLAYRSHL